jgi:hypothetical protein
MIAPNLIPTRELRAVHAHDHRRLAGWLIAITLAAHGCRTTPPDDQRVPRAEPPAPASLPNTPAPSGPKQDAPPVARTDGASSSTPTAAGKPTKEPTAMIEVAGKSLLVTATDAGVLQALLVARIESSKLELRDYLLQAAKGEISVQPSTVTIGRWTLREFNGRLCLYHRGPAPAIFHAAEVAGGTGSWTVREPTQGEILMRPRS